MHYIKGNKICYNLVNYWNNDHRFILLQAVTLHVGTATDAYQQSRPPLPPAVSSDQVMVLSSTNSDPDEESYWFLFDSVATLR